MLPVEAKVILGFTAVFSYSDVRNTHCGIFDFNHRNLKYTVIYYVYILMITLH